MNCYDAFLYHHELCLDLLAWIRALEQKLEEETDTDSDMDTDTDTDTDYCPSPDVV